MAEAKVRSQSVFVYGSLTHAKFQELMPGGVSSPVRAFKSVGGEPIVFDRVKDQYCWDVDGNKYIDYVGTWGPAICGHCNDEVNAALVKALEKGTSFGAPSYNENVLAKMVIDAVPSVEMVRFTNSGTEACMGMLRLVRAYTKREKIIKFEGCYHGHADGFLVSAGSGVITLGLPDSPGVPKGAAAGTLTAQYNDLKSVQVPALSPRLRRPESSAGAPLPPTAQPPLGDAFVCAGAGAQELLDANKNEIAAIVLEPVVGNAGFIPPTKVFLLVNPPPPLLRPSLHCAPLLARLRTPGVLRPRCRRGSEHPVACSARPPVTRVRCCGARA